MKKWAAILCVVATACSSANMPGPKQTIGAVTLGGGAAYACHTLMKGSSTILIATTAGCAVVGLIIGGSVGNSLDKADATYEKMDGDQMSINNHQQIFMGNYNSPMTPVHDTSVMPDQIKECKIQRMVIQQDRAAPTTHDFLLCKTGHNGNWEIQQ